MTNRLAALAALALAGTLVAAPSTAPSAGRQAAPTPLQLFQKLLPVIRHPRCSNCHGDVNPFVPRGHKDKITTEDCASCHNDVPSWGLPIPEHFFPGKTDEQLCSLFSDFAAKMGHQSFIANHLRGDELIIAAFEGEIGGARLLASPVNKPPRTQAEFIALAEDWLARGQGACVVDGSITQVESIDTTDAWVTGDTNWEMEQKGTRTVTVTLSSGQFRADIKVKGSNTLTFVKHTSDSKGLLCTVTSVTVEAYVGSGTGPASVVTKDTMLFADTRAPGKDYRIDVTLPPETTHHTETNLVADGCGFGIGAGDPDTRSFDRKGWTFTIEGHMDDPRYPHLFGACDKTIHSGDLGVQGNINTCFRYIGVGLREPWLMHHAAAASNHDGSDVPFRVVTYWNIAYKPR